MQEVLHFIQRAAGSTATVLITGETGTGKELAARAIHNLSVRKSGPFASINCASMPAALIENELFGHVPGAYTGANGTSKGKFEYARGGTLFLDEVGEMPPEMQPKLLRVLQEKTFERLGSNESITTDVRIIAATNQLLKEAMEQRKFREDLYYRLNVLAVHMPPLRERKTDIPRLVREFSQNFGAQAGRKLEFTAATMECLTQFGWPGNVRQLENIIERLIVLHDGEVVDRKDLPKELLAEKSRTTNKRKEPAPRNSAEFLAPDVSGPHPAGPYFVNVLDESGVAKKFSPIMNEVLVEAVRYTNGNHLKAAQMLGADITTLNGRVGATLGASSAPLASPSSKGSSPVCLTDSENRFKAIEVIQKEIVDVVIGYSHGNRLQAAAALDISRSTLNRNWPVNGKIRSRSHLFLG